MSKLTLEDEFYFIGSPKRPTKYSKDGSIVYPFAPFEQAEETPESPAKQLSPCDTTEANEEPESPAKQSSPCDTTEANEEPEAPWLFRVFEIEDLLDSDSAEVEIVGTT